MTVSCSILLILSVLSISSAFRTVTPRSRLQVLQYKKVTTGNRPAAPIFDPFSTTGFSGNNLENNKIVKQQSPLSPVSQDSLTRIYSDLSNGDLIGEDAATFSLSEQKLKDWGTFLVAVGGIISFLFYVWIYDGGPLLGDQFKNIMESLAGGDTTVTIVYMLGFFAVAHSGLASLRPAAEKIVGEIYSETGTISA